MDGEPRKGASEANLSPQGRPSEHRVEQASRNIFKDRSLNLQELTRASWCTDDDTRSALLCHQPDDYTHAQANTRSQQIRHISECPWPHLYQRYIYYDGQNRRVFWVGAHDPASGLLIPVNSNDDDFANFLQAFPGGRCEIAPGPVCANTGSRLDQVLFHFGGQAAIDMRNEQRQQQSYNSVPRSIQYKLETGQLSDEDLEQVSPTPTGKGRGVPCENNSFLCLLL
ncbi:hypothetical protein DFQ27_007650 [Actinomortierella ambigua]|uniref:Uncharacterized protein n=1 Tax=Actinomortierella ambigua TaxID=1343610 RepID=A0A9P6TZF1_9FUNG|nr:hypothetical protein DFQ27_007650 [Actinomortierella ambigua]